MLNFLTLWLFLLLKRWLYQWRKFLVYWCFQEIILLYLQSLLILCLKCRLYNSGSAKLQERCNSLATHDSPMCALCWFSRGLVHWCLMVQKVFCCSQMYPSTLRAMISCSCLLMVWSCSTWFDIVIWICPIGALVTSCQFHWDQIKMFFECPDIPLSRISYVHVWRLQWLFSLYL